MIFKNDSQMPEGIIISDLARYCENQDAISCERRLDKWEVIPYETATICGNMLSAFETTTPPLVKLNVNLTGWHKIYVALINNTQNNRVFMKLTKDRAQSSFCPEFTTKERRPWWKWENIEESFWKCADMTEQSVELIKRNGLGMVGSMVAWLRFVPMTEKEVAEWEYEQKRTDTKRVFAACDMYSQYVTHAPQTPEDWLVLVENLKHTDVEIFSLEQSSDMESFVEIEHDENSAFFTDMRKVLYYNMQERKKSDYEAIMNYAHEIGIKVYLGKRMGVSHGVAYPYDGESYDISFARDHMEMRCKNRDGSFVDAVSFVYPEAQDEVIKCLLKFAAQDCDGITLIYTRGIPFVLFEEPVLERFGHLYPDVNPCELPLDDERVKTVHCEIMTDFMRRLRSAVDAECKRLQRRPLAVHAYVGTSLEDNRMIGLDIETWAKEGLIDSFTAYPLKIRERLEDVMQKDAPDRINLEAYTRKSRENFHKIIHRYVEYDRNIELQYVKEYVELSHKYNVKVYFELLRQMYEEDYCERAAALCELGAENFSLWDCDTKGEIRSEMAAASRLGHLEDIKAGTLVRNEAILYRILSIGGKNISIYNPTWLG